MGHIEDQAISDWYQPQASYRIIKLHMIGYDSVSAKQMDDVVTLGNCP